MKIFLIFNKEKMTVYESAYDRKLFIETLLQPNPLTYSIERGNKNVYHRILETKILQEDLDQALKLGCLIGDFDVVRDTIEKGASVQVDENYCIVTAGKNKHYDIIKYLAQKGASIKKCKELTLNELFQNKEYSLAKIAIEEGFKITKENIENIAIDLLILYRFFGLSAKYLYEV